MPDAVIVSALQLTEHVVTAIKGTLRDTVIEVPAP
jgi:hypothetical protein